MHLSDWLTILGLMFAIVGPLLGWIISVSVRLAKVELMIKPIWKYIEEGVPDMLKQPLHLHKDGLIDKFRCGAITLVESLELKEIIRKEYQENPKDPLSLARLLMLANVDHRIREMLPRRERKNYKHALV